MLKNKKFDICMDSSETGEKGLIGMRCDYNQMYQRFLFQFELKQINKS